MQEIKWIYVCESACQVASEPWLSLTEHKLLLLFVYPWFTKASKPDLHFFLNSQHKQQVLPVSITWYCFSRSGVASSWTTSASHRLIFSPHVHTSVKQRFQRSSIKPVLVTPLLATGRATCMLWTVIHSWGQRGCYATLTGTVYHFQSFVMRDAPTEADVHWKGPLRHDLCTSATTCYIKGFLVMHLITENLNGYLRDLINTAWLWLWYL